MTAPKASGSTAVRLERIAEEARRTLLQDAINLPFPGICDAWDVPDLGDDYRAPVRSEVPALLISGTLDGRTPPSNAEEILTGLPRGVHLVIEGGQLFTQRGEGRKLPIVAQSETDFFYPGSETHLRFVTGEDGRVRHMVMYQNGEENVATRVE